VGPTRFVDGSSFSEGLAAVKFDDGPRSWGVIDKSGVVVIEPGFTWISDFHQGLAAARSDPKDKSSWVFIDRVGKSLIRLKCEEVGDFIGDRAWVKGINLG